MPGGEITHGLHRQVVVGSSLKESCFLGLSYFDPPLHCLPCPRPPRHTQREMNPDLVTEALGGLVAADLAELLQVSHQTLIQFIIFFLMQFSQP